ncbi:MAG: hypothetical protein Q4P34_05690 [Tissierellia bacterium]|nr:hypothetical protein [Tissierellia bacterium]
MKKIIIQLTGVLLVALMVLGTMNLLTDAKDGAFSVNNKEIIDENYVEKTAMDILKKYLFKGTQICYEDFKREYLLDDNILFNNEMDIRIEYYNLRIIDLDKVNLSTEFDIGDLTIQKQKDDFTVNLSANRIYRFNETGNIKSKEPVNVSMKFKAVEGKIYLVDFIDEISPLFNKGVDKPINDLNRKLENSDIEYGLNLSTSDSIQKSTIKDAEELFKKQLENMESVRNFLRKQVDILKGCQ